MNAARKRRLRDGMVVLVMFDSSVEGAESVCLPVARLNHSALSAAHSKHQVQRHSRASGFVHVRPQGRSRTRELARE